MHLAAEAAVRRIEAGQVRIGIGVAQIVDRHDLDLAPMLALVQRTQNVAADAAIAIDCHLDRHRSPPLSP